MNSHLLSRGIFALGLGMTVYSTFLNVDVYHEGDKFPSSIVLAQGGMIFRDVNNIYGFLPSLIIAPFVHLFGAQLIISRIVGLICKFLVVIVFMRILQKFLPKFLAVGFAGIWLVLTPAWTNIREDKFTNAFAWPTHYGILFLLLSVLIFPTDISNKKFRSINFYVSSFTLAISWSARLEFFSVWVIWTFALAVLTYRKSISFRNYIAWLAGGLTYFFGSLLWLERNGALNDWFRQTIQVWVSNPPAQPQITPTWVVMNTISFLAVGMLGFSVFLGFYKFGVHRIYLYFISLLIVLVFVYSGPYVENYKFSKYNIGAWLNEISNRGLLSYVNIVFAAGLILSVYVVFNFFARNNSRSVPNYILILALSNISLISMLHIVNADYLQMFIMPYAIISIWFISLKSENKGFNFSRLVSSASSTISVFLFVAILSFSQTFFHATFPYKNPILKGLYDQSLLSRNAIDNRMNTVSKYSSSGIWTFCISGLPSISTGQYESKDQWLWNLEPEPWMVARWSKVKADDYLYVCSLLPGEQIIFERNLNSGKLRFVDSGEGFEIYQATGSLS